MAIPALNLINHQSPLVSYSASEGQLKTSSKVFDVKHQESTQTLGGGGLTFLTVILIIGVTLWIVGEGHFDPSMVIAGQVLTGIALAVDGLSLVAFCCWCVYYMNN